MKNVVKNDGLETGHTNEKVKSMGKQWNDTIWAFSMCNEWTIKNSILIQIFCYYRLKKTTKRAFKKLNVCHLKVSG